MHSLTALIMLLAACGHEELKFELPDSGQIHRQGGSAGARLVERATGAVSGTNSPYPDRPDRDSQHALDAAPSIGGISGSNAFESDDRAEPGPYQDDPGGYPAGSGQLAPSCAVGKSFAEVCGNDIDEDCDRIVDEYPGIGAPCRSGCGEGKYVCAASTNALLCLGAQGCTTTVPPPCGDGILGEDEQCDPNAPFEQAGITCTLTCERPLFIRCVDAGVAHAERCDELHVCNERLGACMPVISTRQPRCPRLPIEGDATGSHFYPMLEMENRECWVTCSESAQCPSVLSDCYMGFCAVPF